MNGPTVPPPVDLDQVAVAGAWLAAHSGAGVALPQVAQRLPEDGLRLHVEPVDGHRAPEALSGHVGAPGQEPWVRPTPGARR